MVQLNMAIHQVFREHNVPQGTSCRLVLDLQQIILLNSRLESRDQYFLQIGFGAGSSFADFDWANLILKFISLLAKRRIVNSEVWDLLFQRILHLKL